MNNVTLRAEGFTFTLNVDLSEYETPAGATKAMHRALRVFAEQIGCCPDSVKLIAPDMEAYYINSEQQIADGFGSWGISWEDGPFEWATLGNAEGKWGYFENATSWSIYANK